MEGRDWRLFGGAMFRIAANFLHRLDGTDVALGTKGKELGSCQRKRESRMGAGTESAGLDCGSSWWGEWMAVTLSGNYKVSAFEYSVEHIISS